MLQEKDEVPVVPALLITLAGIALVVLGVAWPWAILARSPNEAPSFRAGSAPRVTDPQPRILGGQPQSSATDELGEPERPAERNEGGAVMEPSVPQRPPVLDRFEWADRERRTVKLPLDIAEALWLEREASRRSGQVEDDAAGSAKGGAP